MTYRHTEEPDLRAAIFEMARQGEAPNREDVAYLKTMYRENVLDEHDIDPLAKKNLVNLDLAEDKKEVERIGKLSKVSQRKVSQILNEGEADTYRSAVALLKEKRRQEREEKERLKAEREAASAEQQLISDYEEANNVDDGDVTVEVKYKEVVKFSRGWRDVISNLPTGKLDVVIAECPLRFDWVASGDMENFCRSLEPYVAEGGFVILTVGHKGLMFVGDKLSQFQPLHCLCLRRQPGTAKFIPGANLISASVMAVLAYKPPFQSPPEFIADVQTYGDENNIESGFLTIEAGLEKCLNRFLKPLVTSESNFAYIVVEKGNQFKAADTVAQYALEAGAATSYCIT